MSKYFGKCCGPSTPAPKFSTQIPLLSKFAAQLKLIQSVVQVGILGLCVTSSILRILVSGFWVSESQVPSTRDPDSGSLVSGSYVSGSQFQAPGYQGPMSQGSRVTGSQVPESWIPGPRVPSLRIPGLRVSGSQSLGSQVSMSRVPGPDFRLCYTSINKFLHLKLTLNNFLFNVINYLQIKGCAMGTTLAPAYINIFIGKLENFHIHPGITFLWSTVPCPSPWLLVPFTFLGPSAQITFSQPPCIKITFSRPRIIKITISRPCW